MYSVATSFVIFICCVHLCITYHAARWMLTEANVYQGSLLTLRGAIFINSLYMLCANRGSGVINLRAPRKIGPPFV